jgi:hypothetical protein
VKYTLAEALAGRATMAPAHRAELAALRAVLPDKMRDGFTESPELGRLGREGAGYVGTLLAVREVLLAYQGDTQVDGRTRAAVERRLRAVVTTTLTRNELDRDFILPQFDKPSHESQPDRFRQDLKALVAPDLASDDGMLRTIALVMLRQTLPPRGDMREAVRTADLLRSYAEGATARGNLTAEERAAFTQTKNAFERLPDLPAPLRDRVRPLSLDGSGEAQPATRTAEVAPATRPVDAPAARTRQLLDRTLTQQLVKRALDGKADREDRLMALDVILRAAERREIESPEDLAPLLPLLDGPKPLADARVGVARIVLAAWPSIRAAGAETALQAIQKMAALPVADPSLAWLREQFFAVVANEADHGRISGLVGTHFCPAVLSTLKGGT